MNINDPQTHNAMRVDHRGRGHTLAVTESRLSRETRNGETYAFNSGPVYIPANTDIWFSRLVVTETVKTLHIVHLVYQWIPDDGTSLLFTYRATDNGAPTSGAIEIPATNLNFTSSKQAAATYHRWDGATSGGMTGNDPTITTGSPPAATTDGVYTGIQEPGRTWDNVDGSIVLANNDPSSTVLWSPSAGWYSGAFTAYLLDGEQELG